MPYAKIFISYSSDDSAFADRLADDLARVNAGVWYDKWEIRVGDSILSKIEQGLTDNDFVALVLSTSSVKSEWVRREVNAALMHEIESRNIKLLPLLYEDCDIPALLREKRYADFRSSYEAGFEDLLLATSPNSPSAIKHSREFRTVQYLLAGLSVTDELGSNVLNEVQLRRVFRFRKVLPPYLGPEERRILFWSALAARYAAPYMSERLEIPTPCWALVAGCSETQFATWILEGISGPLFNWLVPHYDWACTVTGNKDAENLIRAMGAQGVASQESSSIQPRNRRAIQAALEFLAREYRPFFDEHFLPYADKDLPGKATAIRASAKLSPPPPVSFYKQFVAEKDENFLAALTALVQLRRPEAVEFLKERVEKGKFDNGATADTAFELFDDEVFHEPLMSWLHAEERPEERAQVLAALRRSSEPNAPALVKHELLQLLEKDKKAIQLPTLIRAMTPEESLGLGTLRDLLFSRNVLVAESAAWALGGFRGSEVENTLLSAVRDCGPLVASAAIMNLARVNGPLLDECVDVLEHEDPRLRASGWAAIGDARATNWRELLDRSQEQHPTVQIVRARALVKLASAEELESLVDSEEVDLYMRISADEMRFAPHPFRPTWTSRREVTVFDAKVGELYVKYPSFDPEQIRITVKSDILRWGVLFLNEEHRQPSK